MHAPVGSAHRRMSCIALCVGHARIRLPGKVDKTRQICFDPPKMLDINMPAEGDYTLNVIGTGTGTYNADFTAYDINFTRTQAGVSNVPTAPGALNVYQVTFAKAARSQIQLPGGLSRAR